MGLELERATSRLWDEVGILHQHQEIMRSFLNVLKKHAPNMYAHSLRVGLYSNLLCGDDAFSRRRLAVMGGCMHDIGKCTCRQELLSGRDITLEEYEEIKDHAYQGFLMLKNHLPLTAMVAGLHHWKNGRGYGATLDDMPFPVSPQTKAMLVDVVEKVSISDYFDAVQTRNNPRFGLDRNNAAQVMGAIQKEYLLPDNVARQWVGKLYRNKIA